MIITDIFVPSIDRTYDFQLNENTPVSVLVEEISEMICQKEHSGITGDPRKLILCDRDERRVLEKNRTLAECGIGTGRSLILV